MALDREDIKFVLDLINEPLEKQKEEIFTRIGEFEKNAHDMVAAFRKEMRKAMSDFVKKIERALNKIINKLRNHDACIVDLDKRLKDIENIKIITDNKKRTFKENIKYFFDKLAAPVIVAIITSLLLIMINNSFIKKEIKDLKNNKTEDVKER